MCYNFQTIIPTYPLVYPSRATGAVIRRHRIRQTRLRSEDTPRTPIPPDLRARPWKLLRPVSFNVLYFHFRFNLVPPLEAIFLTFVFYL